MRPRVGHGCVFLDAAYGAVAAVNLGSFPDVIRGLVLWRDNCYVSGQEFPVGSVGRRGITRPPEKGSVAQATKTRRGSI